MANVLSQSEIDELLKSLNAGIFPVDKESKPEMRVKELQLQAGKQIYKEQLRLSAIYSKAIPGF